MQVQPSTFSQEEEILRSSAVSIHSAENKLLALILSILPKYNRADKVVTELKNLGYWNEIINSIDASKLLTDRDIEKLYVFVNGYHKQCCFGKNIRFMGHSVGYVFCGKANSCECAKQSMSLKVSKSKLAYNDETKHQINKKRAETNLERYGIDNVFKDINKIRDSYIKKFGVNNPNKLPKIREKIVATNLKRYGTKSPAQSNEIKQQTKESNLENYGVENPMQLAEIQQKQQATMVGNYGVKFPIQNSEIHDKIKNTNIERYGYDNPSKSPIIIEKIRQEQISIFYKKLIERLDVHKIRPLCNVDNFNFIQNQTQWICDDCQTIFDGTAINGRVPRCPICYPKHISAGQTDLINYIVSLLSKNDISINDRTILIDQDNNRKNRELDIVILSKSVAIEYCGLRWHTEIFGNKTKQYHHLKWKDCNKIGLQLLTIYSDEWCNNKKLLQSMISVRLGISNKIYARLTNVIEISPDEARLFFNDNHINGYVNSSINLALIFNDIPVMCMSLSKSKFNKSFDYEIIRMATIQNNIVVGGASKLFNYFVSKFYPTSVISYCDLRYGTGNSYFHMGFIKHQQPTIGYQYVEINAPYVRYDRQHFQRYKLNDPSDKTEHEIMFDRGFDKLWDCGHQKFVWYNKNR